MLLTLLPDLNIAPLKYAHVHKDHGGPIASISFRERVEGDEKFFEAFATLDLAFTGFRPGEKFLYGNAHGTGTAASKPEAIYAAISEALERWAWQAAYDDPGLRASLRYDLDPSTTGFAAFPGLGFQGVRKRAFFEAAERWSLCQWWEGKLGHKPLTGVEGIQILGPVPAVSVVVVWAIRDGLTSYGFAASYSVAAAVAKAQVELRRNQDVLAYYKAKLREGAVPPLNLTERRLRFFAETAGFALFRERLGRAGGALPVPRLAVDLQVPGKWSQWAHVWRCLFEGGPFRENEKDDYFLF